MLKDTYKRNLNFKITLEKFKWSKICFKILFFAWLMVVLANLSYISGTPPINGSYDSCHINRNSIVCLKAKLGPMLRDWKLKKIFLLYNVQFNRRILLSLQLDQKNGPESAYKKETPLCFRSVLWHDTSTFKLTLWTKGLTWTYISWNP